MLRSKCLAILYVSMTAPTASAISAVPCKGLRLRATAAWIRARSRSVAASRSSRFATTLGGEIGVAADHQALAGEVGRGDAGHVALVEQRELQRAALHQPLDRRSPQRRDPIQPGGADLLGDARLGDHAAVADQDDMVEVEPLFELVDLGSQGLRIGGVAVEDFDGDWAAIGGAEQAIDDLQRALPAVTAVAAFGQRAAASFHIAR